MSGYKKKLSRSGYDKLVSEVTQLEKVDLPFVLQQIKEAQEAGDLSENSEYHSAKEKQALMKTRVGEIKNMLQDVEIVDEVNSSSDHIGYGSKVVLELDDGKLYEFAMVGSGEVDVLDGLKISFDSPIGAAIEGKKKGDTVKIKLFHGKTVVKVVDVK